MIQPEDLHALQPIYGGNKVGILALFRSKMSLFNAALKYQEEANNYRIASEANKESVRLLKIDLAYEADRADANCSVANELRASLESEKAAHLQELRNMNANAMTRNNIIQEQETEIGILRRSNIALKGVITRQRRKCAKS